MFRSASGRAGPGKQLCLPLLSAAHLIAASSSRIPPFHQCRSGLRAVVLPYGKASNVSAVSSCLNSYLGSHMDRLTGSDVDSGVCW